jgi:hypothetical protein
MVRMDLFGEPGPHGLFGCEKALLRLGYFEESSSGFLIYKDQPLHNPPTFLEYCAKPLSLSEACGIFHVESVVWTSTKTTQATAACCDTKRPPHCRCRTTLDCATRSYRLVNHDRYR